MKRTILFWLAALLAAALALGLCLLAGASGWGLPARGILRLRLDRVLAGFVVGASLAAAGTVFQALLRNPLADPYVLGVSSGAGLGAAVAFLTGVASVSVAALPLIAFAFAAATLFLVYRLAMVGGRTSIYGLILSGVIVSSVCSSLLMFTIWVSPASALHGVLGWMLGNLEVYSRSLLLAVCAIATVGLAGIWAMAPELNALTLGEDVAHYVGIRTRVAVPMGLALATLTTAAGVSLAGLIGFVGLVVPHVVRAITGPDHRRLVPASALAGGVFLAVCDALARTVLAPREVPVGVVTALIGGPFFLTILRRRRRGGWLE